MSKVNKSKHQNIPLIYCAIKRGVRPIFHECAETHVETPMVLCLLRVKFCSWKLFVCLCFTSLQQQGHLETAPPFTVHCEGREARKIHRSHRESNPGIVAWQSISLPLRHASSTLRETHPLKRVSASMENEFGVYSDWT